MNVIDRAISEMPEDSEVGEILRNNRSEVVSMCLEEYTQEYAEELHRIELEEQKNRAIMLEVKLGESETKVEDLEVKLGESESKVEQLEFERNTLEAERNQAMAELAAIKAQYGIK